MELTEKEKGAAEAFGMALADKELEIRLLKRILTLINILDQKKTVHLGRPRSSDLTCINCLSYLAISNGAFGETLTEEMINQEIERQKIS